MKGNSLYKPQFPRLLIKLLYIFIWKVVGSVPFLFPLSFPFKISAIVINIKHNPDLF